MPALAAARAATRHDNASGNNGVLATALRLVHDLLFDRRYFFHLTALLVLGELVLGLLIIRYVPYTKIDWEAYMQHVECFLGGERDYSKLQGETGPAVYPALFLYIYTALYRFLPPDNRVRAAQYLFLGLYEGTFLGVAGVYYLAGSGWAGEPGYSSSSSSKSTSTSENAASISARIDGATDVKPSTASDRHTTALRPTPSEHTEASQDSVRPQLPRSRYPQALLVPLCLSKRLHSIYMLRLFNDPFGVALFYLALLLFMQQTRRGWRLGSVMYSLALGVKMNYLLYLPGLLVLLVQYRGIVGTIESITLIALIQLLLPSPFFLSSSADARAYLGTAFEFTRQFKYVWTVNWRFVPEETFLSKQWATGLLVGHLTLLVLFALFRWCPVPGGAPGIIKTALSRPNQPAVAPRTVLGTNHIPLVLFTSNLIGIAFARSLHYQFHSWYFHQIPFLLVSGGAWGSIPLGPSYLSITRGVLIGRFALWLGIEYAWATFPSTILSSGTLSVCHAVMLLGLLRSQTRTFPPHRASQSDR